jgi:hypothetical protein
MNARLRKIEKKLRDFACFARQIMARAKTAKIARKKCSFSFAPSASFVVKKIKNKKGEFNSL